MVDIFMIVCFGPREFEPVYLNLSVTGPTTNFQNLTTSLVVIITSLCINQLKCGYVLSRRPTVQLKIDECAP